MNGTIQPAPFIDPAVQERNEFEAAIAKYVPAKRDLMLMLKYTPFGEVYEIKFYGTKLGAMRHVSAMRTQLSRFRAELSARGQSLRKFKINNEGIDLCENATGPCWLIKLRKKQTDANAVSEDVSLILKSISL